MERCEFYTLFSGSSGNSEFIRCGEDAILVDAGKSAAAIERALVGLGSSLSKVKAIFVTHEHCDHVAGLPVIARKYGIPIHVLAKTAYEMKQLPCTAVLHEGLFEETVGSITVRAFYTPHDSICSLGYIITLPCRQPCYQGCGQPERQPRCRGFRPFPCLALFLRGEHQRRTRFHHRWADRAHGGRRLGPHAAGHGHGLFRFCCHGCVRGLHHSPCGRGRLDGCLCLCRGKGRRQGRWPGHVPAAFP